MCQYQAKPLKSNLFIIPLDTEIINHEVTLNEEKFKTLEEEAADAMEVAAQEDEEAQARQKEGSSVSSDWH